MYQPRYSNYGTLGAIAIPEWLKKLGRAVTSGTRITIQTPVGPQTIDLSKPGGAEALARLKESLRSATVDFSTARPQTAGQFVQAGVAQVPGGWGTIALLGAAALLFSGGLGIGRVGRR